MRAGLVERLRKEEPDAARRFLSDDSSDAKLRAAVRERLRQGWTTTGLVERTPLHTLGRQEAKNVRGLLAYRIASDELVGGPENDPVTTRARVAEYEAQRLEDEARKRAEAKLEAAPYEEHWQRLSVAERWELVAAARRAFPFLEGRFEAASSPDEVAGLVVGWMVSVEWSPGFEPAVA